MNLKNFKRFNYNSNKTSKGGFSETGSLFVLNTEYCRIIYNELDSKGEMEMKLTPRLQAIANLVPKGSMVGDVGSDHAYIPVYLVEKDICHNVIASDINRGPVENAKKSVAEYGYEAEIDTRLGGGLLPYEAGEINSVIIAGMGGLLIRDILLERQELWSTIKTFIFQPMVAQMELRDWLGRNGFKIVNEVLAQEGEKFYEIIVAEQGEMEPYNNMELEIGRLLLKNDTISKAFLEKKINKYNTIIENIKNHGSEDNQGKLGELEKQLAQITEVLQCLSIQEK